ncbi:MAG: hypothetical protein NUV82_03680 [Candidatus Komeilibacteria bacterium]|nr:hypothetical protein [Candidatus Komeilibacteria bacterium]
MKILKIIAGISSIWLLALPALAVKINNPLDFNTAENLVAAIIRAVLGFVGIIALIYFIMGGFIWMTAAGNRDKITKGRDTLVWATIGLVVIFASYSLVDFVFALLENSQS